MMNQVIGVILFAPKAFRSLFRVSTLKKLLSVTVSFLMLVSIAYTFIETVDPEPAFASAQLSCFNSDGNPYGFQTKYNSGSDKVELYKWDSSTGNRTLELEYQNLPGSNSNEWNNAMMDNLGNLWMIRKDSSKNRTLYYMDATDSNNNNIADNTPSLLDSWGIADNNAASYFEYNGTGYLLSGNGFLKGSSPLLIRIDGTSYSSSSNYTDVTSSLTVNTNSLAGNLAKAKDFTWLRDGSNFPTFSSGGVSHEADFVAYDNTNDQVMLGYLIVSGSSFTIEITDHSLSSPSSPSWSNSDVGAAFGFGGDHAYFVHNSTGDVRKANYNGSSWSWSASLGTVEAGANKNDGAACHQGAPSVDFDPTVTASQGSCDGTNRQIDVTLNNSSSNVATNFVVTYTVNGGSSQSLTSGTSVSSSSNNTSLDVPGQANGAAVVISWYAENTSENLREPVTGTTSLTTITVDASSCSPTPTSKSSSSSVSAAFGSCSSGSATSTLTITNSDSSTVYYYVDYSINGGTYVNASTNLSVSAGVTNTSLSTSVSHGQNITWRFKASDINNDFTGLNYSTLTTSSNLDCPVIDTTGASSFGSCAAGSKTSTFTMSNSSSANTTAYFRVQYSIDGGGFQNAVTNQSVGINASETTSVSVPHGSTIQWQYEISNTSNTFTGTYTQESTSSAVDCPTIDISASQSLGSCSAGSSTSTLTLSNSNSANSTAYFYVEYSIDGGSNWTEKASNQSVVQNDSESLTQSVAHGTAITWRYKSSSTSGSFTGDYTTLSESATVDCPVLDTSISTSLGSCGSGTALSTFTINNSSSANTTAYFQVEYKLSSESSYTSVASNQAVAPDGTASFNKAVPHGENITWQYRTSSTSNSFSGGYSFGGTSAIVDCPVLATSVSSSFASCSAGSKTSTFTMSNSSSANVAAYFRVQYSIDGGDFVTSTLNNQVAIDSSSTVSAAVPHGSTIQWQYEISNTSNTFTGTYTQESTSSAVDCPIYAVVASHSVTNCTNNGPSQGGTEGRIVLSIDNSGSNADITLLIQIRSTNAVSGNVGDWDYFNTSITGGSSGTSISAGAAETTFRFDDIATGTGREHRYSIDGGSTWTEVGSKLTISCVSVTTSLGSCSSELTQTPTITLNSGADATSSVFFRVEYSIDGGSTWTELENDFEVAIDSSQTLTGPALADGESIEWRYSSRKASGSHDSSLWVTSDTDIPGIDPTLTYTASCIVPTTTTTTTPTISNVQIVTTTTTTTTTLPPTTTTTLKQEIFKPSLFVNRSCSDGGGASFGITALNTNSTVGADIRVKVWVDKKRVFFNTYKVGANNNIFITSIGGVPEDSYFKIKIVFRDELGAHKTVGRFSKITNCDNEVVSTRTSTIPVITTTTLAPILPTDPSIEMGVTTTTVPQFDPPVEEVVDEELLEFENPLTGEEGNDFFVWDDFDEDLYFTDGNYQIQYFYEEDSLKLAATGIDLDYILIGSSLLLFVGFALFVSTRKKSLMSQPGNVSIENIYKNSFKLKTKLEKILKEKVLIKIPLNEMNPYGIGVGKYNERLTSLNAELEYTLVAIRNLEKKYIELDENITKEKFEEAFSLISKNFEIEFTGTVPIKESFSSESEVDKKSFLNIRKKQASKKQINRSSGLAFASILILGGLGLGLYASQQIYLTNFQQQNAQEFLETIYSGDVDGNSDIDQVFVQKNNPLQSDIPVFENLRDIPGLTQNNEVKKYVPNVFGYLEIPTINLKQYVVSGTDEISLQYGPGHYMQTNLPGSGGNVGIAGHRTTYGAPFTRLDLLEVGDTIFLNFGDNKYHYEIDEKLIVDANEGEYVLYDRGDDRITLTTCHPKYSARQRLVISGKLFKIESAN